MALKSAKQLKKKSKNKKNQNQQIQVHMHDREKNKPFKYVDNEIDTSKYTWWNFFPKSIILQFMRTANLYFLLSAIIISIEIISPLSPLTAIGPLILVLACSLVREAIEEHKRVENDKETNSQTTLVYNNKRRFVSIPWKDLQVGDVVKIYKNQMFPADLLVMTSSDKSTGMAFVETANLDGERNLKTKTAIEKVHKYFKSHPIASIKAVIKCDKPNNNIHVFRGQMDTQFINDQQISSNQGQTKDQIKQMALISRDFPIQSKDFNRIKSNDFEVKSGDYPVAQYGQEETFHLTNDNLLLRGTILKNVEWVIGTIIYAGKDSKIMKNQGEVRNKVSKIEKKMNMLIVGTFFLQQFYQALMAVFAYFEREKDFEGNDNYENHFYLDLHGADTYGSLTSSLLIYAAYFILLNSFIPISLIISLEVVKLLQAGFIEFDEKMVYTELKSKPKVLNTLIHEQLGEIEYIFTDKTGTLTSNNMVFTGCCIDKFEFTVKQLHDFIQNQREKILTQPQYHKFLEFLLCLVIAHDCLLDEDAAKEEDTTNKEIFQGSSPDEVCLVQVAYDLGFQFLKRTQNAIFIKIGEDQKIYEFLQKIEFSSDRKRMSIIVKDPDTNKVILYTKGADSYILKAVQQQEHNSPTMILVKDSLSTFSKDGLRTLCLARKEMDYEIFQEWQSEYQYSNQFGITDELMQEAKGKGGKKKKEKEEMAQVSLPKLWQYQKNGNTWEFFDEDVQKDIEEAFEQRKEEFHLTDDQEIHFTFDNDLVQIQLINTETHQQFKVRRLRTIEFLENLLEGDLELLGATAVEDKLQTGVPETLLDIQRAGIKVWMLTGDKLETAQNIGYLSNLLTKNSKIYILSSDSKADTLKNLMKINSRLAKTKKKQREKKLTKKKLQELTLKQSEKKIKNRKQIHRQLSDVDAIKSKTYQVAELVENDFMSNASKKDIADGSFNIHNSHGNNNNNNGVNQSYEFGGGAVSIDIMSRLQQKKEKPEFYEKFDLIIEGKSINYILNSADSQEEFIKLIPELSTVICYRSTPTQKAQVVKFVKQNLKKVTLSIGDGGNDVNMIQEADIGIGIIGKEGNQAALASDYYFGQFRFLWRLLFFHGRHNLKRTAYFINYFFFKNIVFTLIQVWFGFYSRYSSQSIWEDGYLLNFNSIVTAVAPVYFAAYDKDLSPISEKLYYNFPLLYKETRETVLFSTSTYMKWLFVGTLYSVHIFFLTIYAFSNQAIHPDGHYDDLWANSVCQYFSVVLVVLGVLFIDTKQFNVVAVFGYLVMSVLLFFPVFAVMWSYAEGPLQHRLWDHIGNVRFWLIVIMNITIPLIFMMVEKTYRKFFKPTLADDMEDVQNLVLKQHKEFPDEYEPDFGLGHSKEDKNEPQQLPLAQSTTNNNNQVTQPYIKNQSSKALPQRQLSSSNLRNPSTTHNGHGYSQHQQAHHSQFQQQQKKKKLSVDNSVSPRNNSNSNSQDFAGKSIDINKVEKVVEYTVVPQENQYRCSNDVILDEIQVEDNNDLNNHNNHNNINNNGIKMEQNEDRIYNDLDQADQLSNEGNMTERSTDHEKKGFQNVIPFGSIQSYADKSGISQKKGNQIENLDNGIGNGNQDGNQSQNYPDLRQNSSQEKQSSTNNDSETNNQVIEKKLEEQEK